MASEQAGAARGGGFTRILVHLIFAALGVIGGILVWFVAGPVESAGPAAAGGPDAAPDAGAPEGGAVEAAGDEDCVLHVRGPSGALRSDLAALAITDLANKRDLAVELDAHQTARFTCPSAPLEATVVFAAGGQLHAVDSVKLGRAADHVELEPPAEPAEAATLASQRSDAGLEALAWFEEIPAIEASDGQGSSSPGVADPGPAGEPAPAAGSFTVEIRELSGEARTTGDIRDVARNRGADVEACIAEHGAGIDRVRHNFHVAVAENGAATTVLPLQVMNSPELDACVEALVGSWNYGAADQASVFKLKMIWKD